MAKLVGILLSSTALVGGALRRPEEGVIACSRAEADALVDAKQGEIVKLAQPSDDQDAAKVKAAAAKPKSAADAADKAAKA